VFVLKGSTIYRCLENILKLFVLSVALAWNGNHFARRQRNNLYMKHRKP